MDALAAKGKDIKGSKDRKNPTHIKPRQLAGVIMYHLFLVKLIFSSINDIQINCRQADNNNNFLSQDCDCLKCLWKNV